MRNKIDIRQTALLETLYSCDCVSRCIPALCKDRKLFPDKKQHSRQRNCVQKNQISFHGVTHENRNATELRHTSSCGKKGR